MKDYHSMKNSTRRFFVGGMLSLCSFMVNAETLYLEKGGARTFKMKEAIDTVFTSSPDIVDYQILSDKEVVIYGLQNGQGEILVVQSGKTKNIHVLVDPLIGRLAQQVKDEYPGSEIELKKVGESYILSGRAADEDSRDAIHQMVGEALGLTREVVKTELEDDGSGTQKVIIRQNEYVSFEKLQNRMTLPIANQVNVKITLVEINKTSADNLGIDWSAASQVGDFVLNQFKFDPKNLVGLVHALGSESLARVLAEPNLSVLSGETASFLVGGEMPIVTRTPEGNQIDYKEFGIKMFVAAKVENSQKVTLTLAQEVSSMAGEVYNVPMFKSRKTRTTIELGDGESFMLSGLLNESEIESLSKIPIIGDIPVLGAMFRNTSSQRERTELVMIATVNLVRPTSPRNIMYPSVKHSTLLERFFNLNGLQKDKNRHAVTAFMDESGFIY